MPVAQALPTSIPLKKDANIPANTIPPTATNNPIIKDFNMIFIALHLFLLFKTNKPPYWVACLFGAA